MRIVLAVLAVMAATGCKDRSAPPEDPAAWTRIEELARPRGPIGPHADLTAALAITERQHHQWSDRLHATDDAPLADYPDGADAVAALVRWFQAEGGLAPAPRLPGPETFRMFELGKLAIRTATDEEWDGLIAGASLGHRLVTQGRTVLEAMIGLTLLADAERKATELGEPDVGWDVPPPDELVRILAAEAIYSRDMIAYLATPEGKRELAAASAEGAEGGDLTPDHARAVSRFWVHALDGASRDEPAATTIDRVRKAKGAAGSSPVVDLLTVRIDKGLEDIARLLAERATAR